jgi:hypothetical protein
MKLRTLTIPCLLCIVSVLTGPLCPLMYAQESELTEYDVKAAFIYNMAKFIEWPPSNKDSIGLCIIGADPFGKTMDNIKGKTVKGKRLDVRKSSSSGELKECHMVFISNSEKDQASRIADMLKDYPVVTIGDTEGYISQGVMINFFMENKKVRFEVNPDRARRAKIGISSQLLKLAKITGEK